MPHLCHLLLACLGLVSAAPRGSVHDRQQGVHLHCSVEYITVWDTEYEERVTQECITKTVPECSGKVVFEKKCEPTTREVCERVYERKCSTVLQNVCVEDYLTDYEIYTETGCQEVEEEQCEDVPREDCYQVTDEVCTNLPWDKCSEKPEKECEEKHKKIPIRVSKRIVKKVCNDLSVPNDEYDVNIKVKESMKKNQKSGEDIDIDEYDVDIEVKESEEKNFKSGGEQDNFGKRDKGMSQKKDSDEDSSDENSTTCDCTCYTTTATTTPKKIKLENTTTATTTTKKIKLETTTVATTTTKKIKLETTTAATTTTNTKKKTKLGDIETFHHGVGGEVFALDGKTLMIKDFTYDGVGPDTFFWVGPEGMPSNVPDETKTKILAHPYVEPGYYEYRDRSAPVLKGAAKEQIILRLPENMMVSYIKWLSVWDRKFSVDFGHLIFPTSKSASTTTTATTTTKKINLETTTAATTTTNTTEKTKLGDIETFHNNASGEVFALDEKTLMIKDFTYKGNGPDTFFWVGPEGTPSNVPDENETKILAHPYVEPGYYEYRDRSAPVLNGAYKEQITLRLPENLTVSDIKWLSVWDRKFSVDHGHLIFPTS